MQYRRIRSETSTGVTPAALIGLGLGLAAGFLLGELYSGEGRRRVTRAFSAWKHAGRTMPSPGDLTDDLQAALERLLGQDAQSLELVPVGRNALELHGWVTSRAARTRAVRTAREALDPAVHLVDRLLVWGEDDAPNPDIALREEPEPA